MEVFGLVCSVKGSPVKLSSSELRLKRPLRVLRLGESLRFSCELRAYVPRPWVDCRTPTVCKRKRAAVPSKQIYSQHLLILNPKP